MKRIKYISIIIAAVGIILLWPAILTHLQVQASIDTNIAAPSPSITVISTYHTNDNIPTKNILQSIASRTISFDEYKEQSLHISNPQQVLTHLEDRSKEVVQLEFQHKQQKVLLAAPPRQERIMDYDTMIASKQVNTSVLQKVFEVTAYFLNIRAEGHAGSAILSTVEKGTLLEVQSILDNGWLKLADGGFVSGKYTRPKQSDAPDNNDEPVVTMETTKPTNKVQQSSGMNAEQIEKLFDGSLLSGHDLGDAVAKMEEEYGINAFFIVAVMKLESGHGKSSLAQKKNNLFGLNAIDGQAFAKGFSFPTKGDSVKKFAQLITNNYVDKGLTTVDKIAGKYCPTDDRWPNLVKSIMKSDYKKVT